MINLKCLPGDFAVGESSLEATSTTANLFDTAKGKLGEVNAIKLFHRAEDHIRNVQIQTHANGVRSYKNLIITLRVIEKASLTCSALHGQGPVYDGTLLSSRMLNLALHAKDRFARKADHCITFAKLLHRYRRGGHRQGRQPLVTIDLEN